jgi:hypothetical protein
MSNRSGQAYALTVLTPIKVGREAALREHLDGLPGGAESPLAKVAGTHFARWVIIPQLVYEGPPQQRDELSSQYLLFTSNFDGGLDAYLDELHRRLAPEAEAIWGECAGFPGTGDGDAFKGYLRRNQLDTTFFVAAYPNATLPEVLDALSLRERLIAFAVRGQGAHPPSLHASFRETFGLDSAPGSAVAEASPSR